ncbi:hypothetical protein CA13_12020 [Planctomycetes bacterium CA13]|uniref:Uncharacterized protein n=1 Tax=Novipirellula herctigrandis TaxID=2527986 RepID=A0A5C5YXM8_9BACT|nr:hypothetical protein CA13_12020 [Planctomycetes bacterium CA13]
MESPSTALKVRRGDGRGLFRRVMPRKAPRVFPLPTLLIHHAGSVPGKEVRNLVQSKVTRFVNWIPRNALDGQLLLDRRSSRVGLIHWGDAWARNVINTSFRSTHVAWSLENQQPYSDSQRLCWGFLSTAEKIQPAAVCEHSAKCAKCQPYRRRRSVLTYSPMHINCVSVRM